MTYVLYADGAARGNPGPASIGAVLYGPDATEPLALVSEVIGHATNNVAEYEALIAGLEAALMVGADPLEIRLDSQLLVKQVTGEYRVKAPGLKPLHTRVLVLLDEFDHWQIRHVRRELNTEADALANAALDR